MKKRIALTLSLLSTTAFADPTIFGMELGQTTETELKAKYNINSNGTNKYSNGNMYSVSTSSINFSGLKSVITIFDTNSTLVAVLATVPKNKFDYINQILEEKYQLVSENIPFVGNKLVKYRDGTTNITLDAPHLSFDMSMSYIQDDFMQAFNNISQAEARKKQENEASQL